jgi:hypothetical protein
MDDQSRYHTGHGAKVAIIRHFALASSAQTRQFQSASGGGLRRPVQTSTRAALKSSRWPPKFLILLQIFQCQMTVNLDSMPRSRLLLIVKFISELRSINGQPRSPSA